MSKSTRFHVAASVLASAVALAASPALASVPHYGNIGDGWGNGDFGSSYAVYAGLKDKQDLIDTAPLGMGSFYASILPADMLQIGTVADTWVTIFGDSLSLAHADAFVYRSNGAVSSQYDLTFAGTTIRSGSIPSSVAWSYVMPLTGPSDGISLGLVSVTVDTAVVTTLGIQGNASSSSSGVLLSATPSARASIVASASVGVACANAGVSGSLTAFKVQDFFNGSAGFTGPSSVSYNLNDWIQLSTLSGAIDVYANDCFSTYTHRLGSFSGLTTSPSLLGTTGNLSW